MWKMLNHIFINVGSWRSIYLPPTLPFFFPSLSFFRSFHSSFILPTSFFSSFNLTSFIIFLLPSFFYTPSFLPLSFFTRNCLLPSLFPSILLFPCILSSFLLSVLLFYSFFPLSSFLAPSPPSFSFLLLCHYSLSPSLHSILTSFPPSYLIFSFLLSPSFHSSTPFYSLSLSFPFLLKFSKLLFPYYYLLEVTLDLLLVIVKYIWFVKAVYIYVHIYAMHSPKV